MWSFKGDTSSGYFQSPATCQKTLQIYSAVIGNFQQDKSINTIVLFFTNQIMSQNDFAMNVELFAQTIDLKKGSPSIFNTNQVRIPAEYADIYKPISNVGYTATYDLFQNRNFATGDLDGDGFDEVFWNKKLHDTTVFSVLNFFHLDLNSTSFYVTKIDDLSGLEICGNSKGNPFTKVLENVGITEKYALTLQSLKVVSIDSRKYFVCTDTSVHNDFSSTTISKSFQWVGNNTFVFSGILRQSNTLSHIFGDFNGDGNSDIIQNHGNKNLDIGILLEGRYQGSDELAPNTFDSFVTTQRCRSGSLIAIDINNDKRDDIICFDFAGQSTINTDSSIGISNYPILVPILPEYEIDIILRNFDVVQRIDLNGKRYDLYTEQSARVYNNVSVPQEISGVADISTSGQKTSFSLKVVSNQKYAEKVTTSISELNGFDTINQMTLSVKIGFSTSFKYNANANIGIAGGGVERTNTFSIDFTSGYSR